MTIAVFQSVGILLDKMQSLIKPVNIGIIVVEVAFNSFVAIPQQPALLVADSSFKIISTSLVLVVRLCQSFRHGSL